LQRADRLLMQYVARMGADPGLLALAGRIKYEDMHVLTREEIARFGIDRRDLVETPWTFENSSSGGMVRKIVTQSDDGGKTYRMSQWRLYCSNTALFQLD